DVPGDQLRVDALVMVVDGHGEDLLRPLLADHVLVEDLLDLGRLRHRRRGGEILFLVALFGDDVVTEVDALVADVDRGSGDQLAHLVLALPAEGADEVAGAVIPVLGHLAAPFGQVPFTLPGRETMSSSGSSDSRKRSCATIRFARSSPMPVPRMMIRSRRRRE